MPQALASRCMFPLAGGKSHAADDLQTCFCWPGSIDFICFLTWSGLHENTSLVLALFAWESCVWGLQLEYYQPFSVPIGQYAANLSNDVWPCLNVIRAILHVFSASQGINMAFSRWQRILIIGIPMRVDVMISSRKPDVTYSC